MPGNLHPYRRFMGIPEGWSRLAAFALAGLLVVAMIQLCRALP